MLGFVPDKRKSITLYAQLLEFLIQGILAGKLSPGTRLPSTRQGSEAWGISRSVVVSVYEQLIAEGWAESHAGLGTYVLEGTRYLKPVTDNHSQFIERGFGPVLWDAIDFRSGIPDPALFPGTKWRQSVSRVTSTMAPEIYSYQAPQGTEALRTEIAGYLRRMRGIEIDPENMIITSGTTQAINIVSGLLLGNREKVLLEDPVTSDIPRILRSNGGVPFFQPVEFDGISLDGLDSLAEYAFLYLTPSHQFPLGSVLSAEKRISLLKLAQAGDSYLIEDDYDSEFRYRGMPLSPLVSLNRDRVVYIGTFSKTLAPGLRIAYLILPDHLVERGRQLKWLKDLHNPVLEQLVLADFIANGGYYSHIRRCRGVYKARSECLQDEIAGNIPKGIVRGGEAGLHLVLSIPGFRVTDQWLEMLLSRGVKVYPLAIHSPDKSAWQKSIILGFGHLDEEKIREGIRILGSTL